MSRYVVEDAESREVFCADVPNEKSAIADARDYAVARRRRMRVVERTPVGEFTTYVAETELSQARLDHPSGGR